MVHALPGITNRARLKGWSWRAYLPSEQPWVSLAIRSRRTVGLEGPYALRTDLGLSRHQVALTSSSSRGHQPCALERLVLEGLYALRTTLGLSGHQVTPASSGTRGSSARGESVRGKITPRVARRSRRRPPGRALPSAGRAGPSRSLPEEAVRVVRDEHGAWHPLAVHHSLSPTPGVQPMPPGFAMPARHDEYCIRLVALDDVQDLIQSMEVRQRERHPGAPVLCEGINGLHAHRVEHGIESLAGCV